MKSVIQRSLLLVVSVFLILLLSSSAFAFPSTQTNEVVKDNWTFWGDSHNYTYTVSTDIQVLTDDMLRAKLWIESANVSSDGSAIPIQGLKDSSPLSNNYFDNSIYLSVGVQGQGSWNNGYIDPKRDSDGPCLAAGMIFNTGSASSYDYTPPSPSAVPEPATVALMVVGLFGMGVLQRRRRNKTA